MMHPMFVLNPYIAVHTEDTLHVDYILLAASTPETSIQV